MNEIRGTGIRSDQSDRGWAAGSFAREWWEREQERPVRRRGRQSEQAKGRLEKAGGSSNPPAGIDVTSIGGSRAQ